jgi:glucose-1-phosphate cytidylyltransferase
MKVVSSAGPRNPPSRAFDTTKPLVNIGIRPIMWHLMRYYAHFSHKDFVLALGYRGDMIRGTSCATTSACRPISCGQEGGRRIDLLTRA